MRIALKHGIGVAAILAAWVLVKHCALRLQGAPAQAIDGVVFNAVAIGGIVLGIRAARAKNGGALTLLLALVGPALMQQQGETSKLGAFFGVSVMFALFGAVFSACASLALRTRR